MAKLPHQPGASKFDFDIEALRGVAAMLVVWGHMFYQDSKIDPGYLPGGIWRYTPPTHLSVLVFFLLSGYVIGLTQKKPLNSQTALTYVNKRFFRLYPSFLLCFGLAIVVAIGTTKKYYPAAEIISHLTMTMGLTAPLIVELSPAWSLTYEVLFYLMFIPISISNVSRPTIIALCLVVGISLAYFFSENPFASSFAFGAAFWTSGLYLASSKVFRKATGENYATMLSLLLLLLVQEVLDAPATIFSHLGKLLMQRDISLVTSQQPIISYRDLAYLPFCVLTVAGFAKIDFWGKRFLFLSLLALPAVTYYHYYTHWSSATATSLVLPTLFYLASIGFYVFSGRLESIAKHIVKNLSWMGGISYGLYIVHYPLLTALHRTKVFSGTVFSFSFRVVGFLATSFVLAVLLDKRLQSWVKKNFTN